MFASLSFGEGMLVDTAAMAAVALVGYLFGRRTRQGVTPPEPKLADGLARAQLMAQELELVTQRIRTEAAGQHASIAAFQTQIREMQSGRIAADWHALGEQADALITPTMKLATNLSLAYDQLRSQQARLVTFSGSRIDRESGLHNRRSVEEQLAALLSTHADARRHFAIALFSVTSAGDDAIGSSEENLRSFARLIEDCVRGNDYVARYSQDEFLVLMPKTTLAGAVVFSERLLRLANAELQSPMWGGVVEAACGESADKVLSRADSALYSARTHATPTLFTHTGVAVRRHQFDLDSEMEQLDVGSSSSELGLTCRSEAVVAFG